MKLSEKLAALEEQEGDDQSAEATKASGDSRRARSRTSL